MNTTRVSLIIAAILALGSAAACGSDSGSDSEPTASHGVQLPTVSQAVFAERGNEVCRSSSAAIGDKFRAMSTPPKPAELTAAYDNMLKESYKVVGEMLEIGAPKGKERELLDLLVEQYKITADVEKHGQEPFFANEDSDPWAGVTTKFANDFGLTDCHHDG
ncbi:hypothetical protein [Nocardioides marmorisolisilvae]|uniref:Uncharacterized protein n=1 Tax=Nocardioides marmorisolisilvae TaxID=1542737 RepID=A0A3N0DQ20_9ACTN|nr:hypothetical protein [Nocardioides marmorisolisilvae]RNL77581.1 hypothetical protein EFL95_16360 [Nocardioides marmorisolisilvae]